MYIEFKLPKEAVEHYDQKIRIRLYDWAKDKNICYTLDNTIEHDLTLKVRMGSVSDFTLFALTWNPDNEILPEPRIVR